MIYREIQGLIDYGIKNELISEDDIFVVRNSLMDILKLKDWRESVSASGSIQELLNMIVEYAADKKIIENTAAQRDLLDTKIMGVLTPMPREVNETFRKMYVESPESATNWYYNFSQKLNYIRSERIAGDIKWTYESEYGDLDITINLSKPEKDPRDIEAAKAQKAVKYPKCQLCAENMGYTGSITHPARQNLRPVNIEIQGEKWYLQYSPYGYFNEHCILFNSDHVPMIINDKTFEKLFDFIDQFPHYIIGSNADLPIVGGSILSHEHFQGGRYSFPMAKAAIEKYFIIENYPEIMAGIVKWPMSVIRLNSDNRNKLVQACSHILDEWKSYSDKTVDVFAETDGIFHNTITPIARKRNEKYEIDLVLRNNRVSDERPLGIFHPNPSLHHIKKENIGLIEVMGLAVLPSRLAEELEILRKSMLKGSDISLDPKTKSHKEWAKMILEHYPEFNAENSVSILKREVGKVFEQVLFDAAIFKRDKEGLEAFNNFLEKISAI